MMHNRAYWRWAWAFRSHVPLLFILQAIPTAPLPVRKDILTLCQTQTPILPSGTLEKRLTEANTPLYIPLSVQQRPERPFRCETLRTYSSQYPKLFLDIVPASIIAYAVKIAPIQDVQEVRDMIASGVYNEISASIRPYKPVSLDFSTFTSLNPLDRLKELSNRVGSNPEVASDTFMRLSKFRSIIQDSCIIPSVGRKTVGRGVSDDFWAKYYQFGCTFETSPDGVTTADCYRLYAETGSVVEGPVELRTAFTYNQLKPRIYFARGGDVIPTSQYMQPIINRLIDLFPEVGRITRFHPPGTLMTEEDVCFIYDYTAFTSNLDTLPDFCDALGDFFHGTSIRLFDIRTGIVEHDLGDLFHQYNKDCNRFADFDIQRFCSGESFVLQHTCGMLGVEGNIFLATLLHGIHLRFITGLDRSRCVGDDAIALYRSVDGKLHPDIAQYIRWQLESIGLCADDKMAIFEGSVDPQLQAYKYVKRPIRRDKDLMVIGKLLSLPSVHQLFSDFDDGIHVFRGLNPVSVHKQILRFIDTLYAYNINSDTIGTTYLYMMKDHVYFCMDRVRELITEETAYIRRSIKSSFSLPTVELWGKVDFCSFLINDLRYDEEMTFPKWGDAEESPFALRYEGDVVWLHGNQMTSLLEKLGYVSVVELHDTVSLMQIGSELMEMYIRGSYRPVREYTVLRDLPDSVVNCGLQRWLGKR